MATAKPPLILVVEDEPLIAMEVVEQLEEYGFRTVAVSDSEQGIFAVEACRPSAAIVDVNLGGRPCVDLAAKLQQAGVPFLVFSGFSPEMSPDALQAAPWLEKPSKISVVADMIMNIIDEESRRAL